MEFLSSSLLPSSLMNTLPVIFLLVNFGEAIRCYQCLDRPKSHERHLSCSYFDKSKKFHADCEHSTFCMKRASSLELNNGTVINISVHTCADQAQKTVIEDESGSFNWGKIVHKYIYNDGCISHPSHFMLTTETTHCFCSTDYCNSSPRTTTAKHFPTFIFFTFSLHVLYSFYIL